jgi:hypothetical protein
MIWSDIGISVVVFRVGTTDKKQQQGKDFFHDFKIGCHECGE